jgi:hypothetical protein
VLRNQTSVQAEHPSHLDGDAECAGVEAQELEHLQDLRMRRNAGAAAGQLGPGALEHHDLDAAPAQQQSREQPGDRPPDDERFHASSPGRVLLMLSGLAKPQAFLHTGKKCCQARSSARA